MLFERYPKKARFDEEEKGVLIDDDVTGDPATIEAVSSTTVVI